MAASTKMSVDISAFKQGMQEATARVKTLDAEMKKAEAQFKSTGDAEAYMTQKAQTLQEKIKAQKDAVANLEKAMKAMKDNGVSETSAQYQKLAERLATAQAAMIETTTELNNLGQSEQTAARGADQLTQSVNGINKKISLDQVISGISTITGGLEKAAGKAVDLGKAIWENVMDSARWADDTATMALMYGVDLDTFLRVQKLVAEGMDTSVEAILNSQARLKKNIGGGSSSIMQTLRELGISMTTLKDTGGGILEFVPKDADTVFWEVGRAIMNLGDEFEKENKAQQLFGKGWKELVPLFSQFKNQEEYNKALQETTVNTEEEVSKLEELNDAVGKLQSNFDVLENKVLSGLAPGLTAASNALSGLLDNLIEYLNTPAGQEALTKMSDAVSGLFEDLGNIDPQDVVNNFASLFSRVVSSFEWLKENWGAVKAGLEGIAGAFALMKISSGVLEFFRLISGTKGIFGGGGNTSGGGGDVVSTVGKVGLFEGIKGAAANFGGKVSSWFGGTTGLLGGAAVGDYLSHNTTIGQALNPELGGSFSLEGLRDGLMRAAAKVEKNLNSFAEDWANNPAYKWFNDNILSPRKTAVEEIVESYENGQKGAQTIDDIMKTLYPSGVNPFGMDGRKAIEAVGDILRGEDPVAIPVEPVTDENAAGSIAEQVGPVSIPVSLVPTLSQPGGFPGGAGAAGGVFMYDKNVLPTGHVHANGIPFVPFDGYIASLHRGERVITASENRNYTFNSNTYFGNVNLNNGMQVEALSESIARQNRKIQRGFGS